MSQEFYNFDEALDQLNLKEEELKRLVSEGEIRAFRDGDTMKLRCQDVEHLRGELIGGDVVDLGSEGADLVFEDDLELDEAGMATEEISEMDTLLEEEIEDVGEVDLGDDEEEVVEATPIVRRSGNADADDDGEGAFMRVLLLLCAAIMVLTMPIMISLAAGESSDLAKALAESMPF